MGARQWTKNLRKDQRGFTLPELLVTIAIMGILLAIAIIIWLGILEQRRVDAAANQFAADLRLAHAKATNQLTDWRITYTAGNANYKLLKLNQPCDDNSCSSPTVVQTISRSLPDGTKVLSAANIPSEESAGTIELNSDGSGRAFYGVSTTVTISSTDGDPKHDITFVAATSRVEIVN